MFSVVALKMCQCERKPSIEQYISFIILNCRLHGTVVSANASCAKGLGSNPGQGMEVCVFVPS